MNNVPVKPWGSQYLNCIVLLVIYLSIFISTLVYYRSRVKHGLMPLFIPYLFRHALEVITSLVCNKHTTSHFAAERQDWLLYDFSKYLLLKAGKASGIHSIAEPPTETQQFSWWRWKLTLVLLLCFNNWIVGSACRTPTGILETIFWTEDTYLFNWYKSN